MKAWKPILAALVIFAAGMATGALVLGPDPIQPPNATSEPRTGRGDRRDGPPGQRSWGSMGSESHIREICDRMERDLKLAPDQTAKIQGLIRESQTRMRAINERMGPEIRDEMRRAREEIRMVLTAEQQLKFDEINKKRESRFRRPEGRPPDSANQTGSTNADRSRPGN